MVDGTTLELLELDVATDPAAWATVVWTTATLLAWDDELAEIVTDASDEVVEVVEPGEDAMLDDADGAVAFTPHGSIELSPGSAAMVPDMTSLTSGARMQDSASSAALPPIIVGQFSIPKSPALQVSMKF